MVNNDKCKVFILDGNSEHVAPARGKICLFDKKKSDL